MSKYFAQINLIQGAFEKISPRLARDVGELINLQASNKNAVQFASVSYDKIKENLNDYFKSKAHQDGLVIDGQKIVAKDNARFTYVTYAIDGINNFTRSLSDFAVVILAKENETDQIVAGGFYNPFNKEIYKFQKGGGAFLNNLRLRVSNTLKTDKVLVGLDSILSFQKSTILSDIKLKYYRITGCAALDFAYLASGKLDILLLKNNPKYKNYFLIAKEAGAIISQEGEYIIVKNSNL